MLNVIGKLGCYCSRFYRKRRKTQLTGYRRQDLMLLVVLMLPSKWKTMCRCALTAADPGDLYSVIASSVAEHTIWRVLASEDFHTVCSFRSLLTVHPVDDVHTFSLPLHFNGHFPHDLG